MGKGAEEEGKGRQCGQANVEEENEKQYMNNQEKTSTTAGQCIQLTGSRHQEEKRKFASSGQTEPMNK